jgi:hypothetical protein
LNRTFTIPYKKIHIPSRGDFPAQVKYSPIVATVLENKTNRLDFSFDSIIDSGADYCVFPSQIGELIGLNVGIGKRLPTYGVGGQETLYFHHIKVTLIIGKEAWEFPCFAGFSRKMNHKGVGLLGRQGFFNLFKRIEFLENKRKLILAAEGGPLFGS